MHFRPSEAKGSSKGAGLAAFQPPAPPGGELEPGPRDGVERFDGFGLVLDLPAWHGDPLREDHRSTPLRPPALLTGNYGGH